MLLWVAPQVGVNRSVPELLNAVPVLDLTTLQDIDHFVRGMLALRLFSDVEVQLRVVKVVFLANPSFLKLSKQKELVRQFHKKYESKTREKHGEDLA